jgi:hypothetical protein
MGLVLINFLLVYRNCPFLLSLLALLLSYKLIMAEHRVQEILLDYHSCIVKRLTMTHNQKDIYQLSIVLFVFNNKSIFKELNVKINSKRITFISVLKSTVLSP